jgi:Flp pilus assembly protein TadG
MVKAQKGQTLIETALVLILLLLILLGISEFARAWYMKNSLKNAVRHGVRLAVVAPSMTPAPTQRDLDDPTCPDSGYTNCGVACPSTLTAIIDAVCCAPGIRNRAFNDPDGGTEVFLSYTDDNPNPVGTLNRNDTVSVCARTSFKTIVHSFSPWIRDITITTDASMRYE